MKLVVGLGNPGSSYSGTRHNVGYEVVDCLAARYGPVQFRRKFSSRVASLTLGQVKVLLLKPETFMNRSGQAVRPALTFYGLNEADLLVVCDDLNLPAGKIRIRGKGSDGGQKGLRSIAEHLGSADYARLRVGIGANPPGQDAARYVLERFRSNERPLMDDAIETAAKAVALWCESSLEECMNRFN